MFKTVKLGVAHLMVAIGLGAGATTLSLNAVHGWDQAAWLAVACVLADFARISIPVIAANRGWSKQMKVGVTLLGLFSFANITFFVADTYGEKIWAGMQQNAGKARSADKIAELKAQISTMEKRSSATLEANAKSEEKNKYCGPKCTDWRNKADEAKRREALEATVKTLESKVEEASVIEVKGWAIALVALGMPPVAAQALIDAIFRGLAPLVVIDMLVYFLIPGFAWMKEDKANAKLDAMGAAPAPKAVNGEGKVKLSKAEAYRKVCAILLETADGSIITSERQLAKLVGASKSTFSCWMKDWEKNGELRCAVKNKHSRLISLPKAA